MSKLNFSDISIKTSLTDFDFIDWSELKYIFCFNLEFLDNLPEFDVNYEKLVTNC